MRYSFGVAAAAFSWHAAAFPFASLSEVVEEPSYPDRIVKRQAGAPYISEPAVFNAKLQYVSTTGKYKFVPPGPLDARGPCPGLNTLANHGYFPHNGVGLLQDFVTSTEAGFGMGEDLSGFLAVYGAIFDGDLTGYSIGGPSVYLAPISGQLGTPLGLSGSHNNYENDASPVRGDLYLYGNDYLNQVSLFQQFIDLSKAPEDTVNYNLPLIGVHRKNRFTNSIQTNPYFFNGPFSGAIASPAAYTFMYRFMANHTATNSAGYLNRNHLKHFYSMTGTNGNYTYTPGHESFPYNWYKRAVGDEYTIPFFAQDAFIQVSSDPEFASVGGNTGKVNTFTGLDPGNLTEGVYNAKTLFQGDNYMCYGFQLGVETGPAFLEGVFENETPAHSALSQAFAKAASAFNCPQIKNLQYGQFNQFPGLTKSYNGYKGHTFTGQTI